MDDDDVQTGKQVIRSCSKHTCKNQQRIGEGSTESLILYGTIWVTKYLIMNFTYKFLFDHAKN